MSYPSKKNPIVLSIGILASNEEDAMRAALESLFRQSVFEKVIAHHQGCEVVVVAHACTDHTVAVTRAIFDRMEREHAWAEGVAVRLVDIPEAGRANAWNRYVHEFSAVEARFLCVMDADVVFHHRDTVYHLMTALERRPGALASVGRACSELLFKERKTWRERLTLAASALEGSGPGRIGRQLYCLRANVARNIFLPRDLGGAAERFVQEMVCTEYLTRLPQAGRVVSVRDAVHISAAGRQPHDAIAAEKQQIVSATAAHVLGEFLRTLAWKDRVNLADTLRRKETSDPDWLKRLIAAHLAKRWFFWRLCPGALRTSFAQLAWMPGLFRKATYLPVACASLARTLVACAQANRLLRRAAAEFGPKPGQPATLSVSQAAK